MWGVVALAALNVWVGSSLEKVRPDRPLPSKGVKEVRLDMARGECEAAQVVVTGPAAGLRASATHPLPTSLFRVGFIPVKTPSNVEGEPGDWPDPLIPDRDEAGEKRNAFPVDVAAGRHQPLWVEVCVPQDAKPGLHTGSVVLKAKGARRKVALKVRVHDVTIPATSSFPVTFGLSGKSLELGHYGKKRGDEARLELVHRYAREALRHRISLHTMSMLPPRVTERGVDFSRWDEEIGPYLDGTALPNGARFTAIDLRTPPGLEGEELARYYRAVEAHFRKKGWLDRLFAYVMDEPRPADRKELVRRLDALSAAPGIRRLVTTAWDAALEDKIDVWVPNVNCLFVRDHDGEMCPKHPPRVAYRKCEKAGAEVWWYQSCSSHGCNQGPFGDAKLDAYFTGWPSYMVDAPATSARAMGWLAFLHELHGELYFDMAYQFNFHPHGKDPWDGLWAFGGNGDGTLFYPGRPDKIGGETHVPVASLRLKLIRDSLEDQELLRLLAKKPGGRALALALARELAPKPWEPERSPERWRQVRARLLKALAG